MTIEQSLKKIFEVQDGTLDNETRVSFGGRTYIGHIESSSPGDGYWYQGTTKNGEHSIHREINLRHIKKISII